MKYNQQTLLKKSQDAYTHSLPLIYKVVRKMMSNLKKENIYIYLYIIICCRKNIFHT